MKRLRVLADAVPPGGSVSLPADWLREELAAIDAGRCAVGDELTVDLVAVRLRRAPSTVRGWCEAGELPGAYRLRGREWRIPARALDAFLTAERKTRARRGVARGPVEDDLSAWRRRRR